MGRTEGYVRSTEKQRKRQGKEKEKGAQAHSPISRTVPGGVAALTDSREREKAYFHPGIVTVTETVAVTQQLTATTEQKEIEWNGY